jgi:alkaline phosphatase
MVPLIRQKDSSSPTARATLGHTLILLGAALLLQACAQPDRGLTAAGPPKVILIIGDGMDDQQVTIARNYLVGSDGRLTLDEMPFRGSVQVQAVSEDDPTRFEYVSDSANTATSMATGELTSQTRIATTAGTDHDLVTIVELARDASLGTGIVTTSSLTDATPAAFVAHVNQRFCQGPRNMRQYVDALQLNVDCSRDYKANGGKGSISEQIADSRVDIFLGGGALHFDQPVEGNGSKSVTDVAAAQGYRIIRTRNELATLDSSERVLGLFARDTMPVRWRGEDDARAERIETIDGKVQLPKPFSCEPNPRFEDTPTLTEMTVAALEHLDPGRGFVLMIESASIDKQSHVRRPCGHIGELAQLDEALTVTLEYADQHPETLVLVTADHSHAAQIVSDTGGFLALNYASPGHFARVLTPEGSLMGINYATNDSPTQEYHTGSQVPLYASGPGAEELPTFVAQRELFGIMARHLGLAP